MTSVLKSLLSTSIIGSQKNLEGICRREHLLAWKPAMGNLLTEQMPEHSSMLSSTSRPHYTVSCRGYPWTTSSG